MQESYGEGLATRTGEVLRGPDPEHARTHLAPEPGEPLLARIVHPYPVTRLGVVI